MAAAGVAASTVKAPEVPCAHDPREGRLAHQLAGAALDQARRAVERRIRGRDVAPGAVVGDDVDDAHVAHQRQRDAGQPLHDLRVVERQAQLAAGLGQEVEPALGGLGPAQGGPLRVEQPAAFHRAGAEAREGRDEGLAVGRERVRVVPAEAEHAEPASVDLERHGRDRALLGRRDPEPRERGPVAAT